MRDFFFKLTKDDKLSLLFVIDCRGFSKIGKHIYSNLETA